MKGMNSVQYMQKSSKEGMMRGSMCRRGGQVV